jgi:hypothetical protein
MFKRGDAPKREPEYDAGHVPMSEELDDAKHTLPPIAPVAIAIVVVAAIIIGSALLLKQPPAASGSIGEVYALEIPHQNSVLCTMQITVQNHTKKPLTIRSIYAVLHSADQGDLTDNAAPAGDFARYVEAFPELKSHAGEPLRPETKIQPGTSATGTILVAFPVTRAKFDTSKGVGATVELYDYTDLKLSK